MGRLDSFIESTRKDPLGPGGKGVPPGLANLSIADVSRRGLDLFSGGFVPPVMTMNINSLEHNAQVMSDYCRDRGVLIAPHGKTTMSPSLFATQMRHGAWGITAATASQVMAFRDFGIERIIMANELVSTTAANWVRGELEQEPNLEFFCYVDSLAGVERLGRAFEGASRPLNVLIDLGYLGGRTGCRTVEQASLVASEATRCPGLRVAGVTCYEGGLSHDRAEGLPLVRELVGRLVGLFSQLHSMGTFEHSSEEPLISAGGSLFFDAVVDQIQSDSRSIGGRVLLRSGCYLIHDHGLYDRLSPFAGMSDRPRLEPSLELWGEVLSVPEPGLALLGFGRRDAPVDSGMPIPLSVRRGGEPLAVDVSGLAIFDINDQHAYLRVPSRVRLEVGDWMSFGISHPCTAFDKWRLIPVVDNQYRVVDLLRTYF